MDDLSHITEPKALRLLSEKTQEIGFSMASEPRTGALLRALAASKPAGKFLELGTGTGLATAWLLDGMDADSQLTSVDTDAIVQQVAEEFLGSDARLQLVTQDAAAFLRAQPAESFDFVFADAMPGKYDALDDALAVVKRGGIYIVDDMLPQPNWPEGHAAKIPAFIADLEARGTFEICPMSWASGVVVAVKK
jgi:predicted O-methyltransferase YrrM